MSKKTDLERLKVVWYKKLAESGFIDIESSNNNLKRWSTKFTSQKSINTAEAKEEYYYMAQNFLISHKFKSERERVIWEYHTNAIGVRNIAKLLEKVNISIQKTAVHRTIKRLRKIMFSNYKVK